MFSTLEVEHRYVVAPVTRETIYRSFLPQRVERSLGPGRRVCSSSGAVNALRRRDPLGLYTRNATPLRLGSATTLRRLSLFTALPLLFIFFTIFLAPKILGARISLLEL